MTRPAVRSARRRSSCAVLRPTIDELDSEARIVACIGRAEVMGRSGDFAELCEKSLAVLESIAEKR